VRVTAIRSAAQWGDFSLRTTASPTLNAFINLPELQRATDLTGRVNTVLVPSQSVHVSRLEALLRRVFPDSTIKDLKMVTDANSPIWNETIQKVPDTLGFEQARMGLDIRIRANRLSQADLVLSPAGKGEPLN